MARKILEYRCRLPLLWQAHQLQWHDSDDPPRDGGLQRGTSIGQVFPTRLSANGEASQEIHR